MIRFAIFVDGSNQFGSFRQMGIRVDDYEEFYRYVFAQAVDTWRQSVHGDIPIPAQLRRVYWYTLGSMDEWDLDDDRALDHLRKRFNDTYEVRSKWMQSVGPQMPGKSQSEIATAAFHAWLGELRSWLKYKWDVLDGMRRFHHALRASTDFIDVIECGHWKVDPIDRSLSEKGIDTALAVDMIALADNYDVGIIVSGDADHIPSIRYLKTRNKHISAVEFVSGYPPEKKGRNFSSHLKLNADFVVPVYEMELIGKGLAAKGSAEVAV